MTDPYKKFNLWFAEVKKKKLQDPTAFALGTSDKSNQPHIRMVLLKKILDDGFVFFTNLNSNKGKQFELNNKMSMCFYWESIGKQIRINGIGKLIDNKSSDDYFVSRARESRIGAWASNQSQKLNSRKFFLERIDHYKKKFKNKMIPRPPHWAGIKIEPLDFEFWKQGKYRLHEREYFFKKANKWDSKLLFP